MSTNFRYAILTFILLTLSSSLHLYAQESSTIIKSEIAFTHITTFEGLPSNVVNDVVQDTSGFIWISTSEGLCKYDGKNIKTYTHDPEDPTSIGSNNSWKLLIDHSGTLWVALLPGGLCRYDPATDSFTTHSSRRDDALSLSNNIVIDIFEDNKERLWVCTNDGLNLMDRETGSFKRYLHDALNPDSISTNLILEVFQDDQDTVWFGSQYGELIRYQEESDSFTSYPVIPEDSEKLLPNYIWKIHQDISGNFWIGTSFKGLYKFDRNTSHFTQVLSENGNTGSIIDIYDDKKGHLWLATEKAGVVIVDKVSGNYQVVSNDYDIPSSLSDNYCSSIFQSRDGMMWFATKGGLSSLNPENLLFGLHRRQVGKSNTLAGHNITSIAKSGQDLIVTTLDGGLNVYDEESGHYRFFDSPLLNSDNQALSVLKSISGRILIGTSSLGILELDINTGSLSRLQIITDENIPIDQDAVNGLYESADGIIWILSGPDVFRYDPASTTARVLNLPGSSTALEVMDMVEDESGILWFATSFGLYKMDRELIESTEFEGDRGSNSRLPYKTLTTITKDTKGNLWIGTNNGLVKFDQKNSSFKNYNMSDHNLSSNVIESLEYCKETGYIWISTQRGITVFDPEKEHGYKFTISSGLQGNVFNPQASLVDRDGFIYFGGTKGFNKIAAHMISPKPFNAVLVATRIVVSGRDLGIGKDISKIDALDLDHSKNVISIEFSALDYLSPEEINYFYKLEGEDKYWNYGKGNIASYMNLSPGKYKLRMQAQNSAGIWDPDELVLDINISPPFWETIWFKLLAGFSIFGAIAAAFITRSVIATRRQRILEKTVQQRTKELEAAKKEMELLANTDTLTGLFNRRKMMEMLNYEVIRFQRSKSPFVIVIGDIDKFKSFNDVHGHECGDFVLSSISSLIKSSLREQDVVARWGGEEFLLMLPDSEIKGAKFITEHLKDKIAASELSFGDLKLSITMTFGVCQFSTDLDITRCIALADKALYHGKNSGRNRVVLADEIERL